MAFLILLAASPCCRNYAQPSILATLRPRAHGELPRHSVPTRFHIVATSRQPKQYTIFTIDREMALHSMRCLTSLFTHNSAACSLTASQSLRAGLNLEDIHQSKVLNARKFNHNTLITVSRKVIITTLVYHCLRTASRHREESDTATLYQFTDDFTVRSPKTAKQICFLKFDVYSNKKSRISYSNVQPVT